jgi:hypothetical protein
MIYAIAQNVQQKDVNFLNAHGAVVRHTQVDIVVEQKVFDLPAAFASEGDDTHFTLMGRRNGKLDVR